MARFTRIAFFYDGNFFIHASLRFATVHPIRQRLDLEGFENYLALEAAKALGSSRHLISERHFFRGKPLGGAPSSGGHLEDALLLRGYTVHQLPLLGDAEKGYVEKGVDVALAVEALAGAADRRFDVLVLVAGDGDFIPLVRKLRTYGVPTVLPFFDLPAPQEGHQETRTSKALAKECHWVVDMGAVAESAIRSGDRLAGQVFGIRPLSLGEVNEFYSNEGLVMEGVISRIFPTGTGGRILVEDTGEDLFFPIQEVAEGTGELQVGDRVRFLRVPNRHPAAKEPYMAARVEKVEAPTLG